MHYQKASQYWIEKDKEGVRMEKEELKKRIDSFIENHNTLALATGYNDEVRCTPLEYNYYDGYFYIFSEGGLKFKNLEHNKNVSAAIFEPYQGFNRIHSLQITGVIEIISPESEEFTHVCQKKGINIQALNRMNVPFHLLKLVPNRYNLLDSDLKALGYSNRQEYIF